MDHGHFYVVVGKKGSLFNFSDYEPFAAYKVEAWWLDNLPKAEKLEHEVYLRYASRVGIGFKRRLAPPPLRARPPRVVGPWVPVINGNTRACESTENARKNQ